MSPAAGLRALVTGAGVGIGQAIAVELGRRGASVAVHTSSSSPEDTLATLEAAGAPVVAVRGDLGEAESCAAVVELAAEGLGGLDVLVNNAGRTLEKRFGDTTAADFDALVALNLRGYFLCAQAAAAAFGGAGGAIVNVSSIHGAAGLPRFSAYAATKGGVDALTRALAVELAPAGIRVNAVAPGVVEVPRYHGRPGYHRGLTLPTPGDPPACHPGRHICPRPSAERAAASTVSGRLDTSATPTSHQQSESSVRRCGSVRQTITEGRSWRRACTAVTSSVWPIR